MKTVTLEHSENTCGHCDSPLVWKAHKEIKAKQLNAPFYYSKWEYCPECGTVWFDKTFMVMNKNAAATKFLRAQQERIDFDTSFIKKF